MTQLDKPKPDKFIRYDIDNASNPADKVIEWELKRVNDIRESKDKNFQKKKTTQNCIGLALSGGGIRSATFSLGVVQAMAKNDWLKHIDYLSTVSGGGYFGSSLSFLLQNDWNTKPDEKIQFDTSKENFPFGYEGQAKKDSLYKIGILRFLRQHGNYLIPGRGLTFLSFVAAYLRGFVMNFTVYFPWLTLFLIYLYLSADKFQKYLTFLPKSFNNWSPTFITSASMVLVFILICAGYSLGTWLYQNLKKSGYKTRTKFSRRIRYLLILILILTVLGIIEAVDHGLKTLISKNNSDLLQQITGVFTALAGLMAALKGFLKSGEQKPSGTGLWVSIGSGLLLFGLLLLSFQYHQYLKFHWPEGSITDIGGAWILFLCWLAVSILLGNCTNINYLSVHRYYRDRLMESFMPDLEKIFRGDWNDKWPGERADKAVLYDMCQTKLPYHIVNTNAVLVDSWIPKFKGRGGDNFILSPLYCGSNATGWRSTDSFMNNRMTLPTAMAISGAALNPNTGVGGDGMTRNRLLSIVLNLLNLRLGYWAPNPKEVSDQKLYPNFLRPISFFFDHNESNKFIELSDGGHFENLALYELFRRRLKTIIVIDAGMDSSYTFEDLGNAVEKARVDFGIKVSLDLKPLIPDSKKRGAKKDASRTAQSGFVVGKITYPEITADPSSNSSVETKEFKGDLIYIKTTYIKNLPQDVVAYKNLNPLFPDQSTADQFFDEKQFEAYRELGYQIAQKIIDDITAVGESQPDPNEEEKIKIKREIYKRFK